MPNIALDDPSHRRSPALSTQDRSTFQWPVYEVASRKSRKTRASLLEGELFKSDKLSFAPFTFLTELDDGEVYSAVLYASLSKST
jgi:hypothetical protein